MKPLEILKEKGLKITKGRLEIFNILLNSQSSLSAEKIYQIYRHNKSNINLSTIYRTLDLFEEKEIVDKTPLSSGVFSYTIKSETHKHHLECDICHKEVEIPCPVIQIQEIIKSSTGFTLTEHDLVMKGVCEDCKKNR